VLYWRFLDKHGQVLLANPRTALMTENLSRLSSAERAGIRSESERVLQQIESL
jgi:deoxyribodipyrimidine photolyase-like uncharacterized protein